MQYSIYFKILRNVKKAAVENDEFNTLLKVIIED